MGKGIRCCPEPWLHTDLSGRIRKVNQRSPVGMTMKTRQDLSALTLRKLQICCLASTENSPPASVISSTIGFSSGLWLESINVISALLG
jgi:hypothetical protein